MIHKWFVELLLLSTYKYLFESVLLKKYMGIFEYLFSGVTYNQNLDKWLIGTVLFFLLSLLLIDNRSCRNKIYNVILRFIFCICIIPMLSVYSFFDGIDIENVFYPFLFYIIFILALKHYGTKKGDDEHFFLNLPEIKNVDNVLLIVCGGLAILIWAISGFPVALNFDIAYERRMALRIEELPVILNYLFMFLGGTVFPYLFAKNWSNKRYFYSFISLAFGIVLYFVNGMKTWLLLYPLFIGIIVICKLAKEEEKRLDYMIDLLFIFIVIVCVAIYESTGIYDLMSQFARVTVIPNNIGFKSVDFFKSNELLYLRESILRKIWHTPYEGGSDFYINYGANSTLTSSRANNGLWGDAFRNFGLIGVLLYPLLTAKVFHIVEMNCRGQKFILRLFVLFLVLWSSINTSFFTWLLTGGVIIIVIMTKVDNKNMKHIRGENN